MHEVPIVRNLVRTLEERYKARFVQISTVRLEVGLLSNVQPILIQNAFEAVAAEDPRLEEVELEIVQLPIVAHCTHCKQDFEVKKHRFVCNCGTPSRQIVQGKELKISAVSFVQRSGT